MTHQEKRLRELELKALGEGVAQKEQQEAKRLLRKIKEAKRDD